MKDMIKLDMIVLLNSVFVEFSDVYYFKVAGKELYKKITEKCVLEDLKKSSKEYYDDKNYYKYLKRMYSMAIMKNNIKRIKLLNEYFNSVVGLCYKCASDLSLLELLLDCKFRKVNLADIHSNLQIIKQKLSSCVEIEHKSFSSKIDSICEINESIKLKKEIHKIIIYLHNVININAENFIKIKKLII